MSDSPESKPTPPDNRTRAGQFRKGVSGNPNGKPKEREEFKARARKLVDELVLDAWEQEIRSQGDNWVKCTELLTAYGIGKPAAAEEDRASFEAAADKALQSLTRRELLAVAGVAVEEGQ